MQVLAVTIGSLLYLGSVEYLTAGFAGAYHTGNGFIELNQCPCLVLVRSFSTPDNNPKKYTNTYSNNHAQCKQH